MEVFDRPNPDKHRLLEQVKSSLVLLKKRMNSVGKISSVPSVSTVFSTTKEVLSREPIKELNIKETKSIEPLQHKIVGKQRSLDTKKPKQPFKQPEKLKSNMKPSKPKCSTCRLQFFRSTALYYC